MEESERIPRFCQGKKGISEEGSHMWSQGKHWGPNGRVSKSHHPYVSSWRKEKDLERGRW